eukprot:TRINITY_DN5671_c0_g1_i1.p1 TRINITY_DN5671_c0_g1~~TRINITY_DN5671_c0_g1_i1.p1  ORF type:complete len:400 (+),score=91.47 TRINITY_DN5671_c0_g1_i1:66-1265(+)
MGNYNTHRNNRNTNSEVVGEGSPASSSSENQASSPLSRTRRTPRRLIFIYDFELPGRNRRNQTLESEQTEYADITEETNNDQDENLYLGELFNENNEAEQDVNASSASSSDISIDAIAEEINSELESIESSVTEDLPPLEPTSEPTSPPSPSSSNPEPTTSPRPTSRSGVPRMRVWIEVSPNSLGLSGLLGDSDSAEVDSSEPRQVTGHVIFVQVLPAGYTDPVSPEDDLQEFLNHTFQLHAQSRGGNPPASKQAMDDLEQVSDVSEYKDKQPQCTICYCEFEQKSESGSESEHNCNCNENEHNNDCNETTVERDRGEEVVKIECGHLFHRGCIENWLKEHNTCPLCRWELPTEDVEYEKERVKRMEKRRENVNKKECMENNGVGSSSVETSEVGTGGS